MKPWVVLSTYDRYETEAVALAPTQKRARAIAREKWDAHGWGPPDEDADPDCLWADGMKYEITVLPILEVCE